MSTTVRKTFPRLTRFERARIIGTRAQQISNNASPLVDIEGEFDPLRIAEKELHAGVIPLVIRRFLGDGTYEDWNVRDLKF